MSSRKDRALEYSEPYIRSSSRNSRADLFPTNKQPARTYKDFVSYASQVENSSSHSDFPKVMKRSSKITSLQQQFEDLKRKIREVQNKNQKIIQKINFGKETPKRKSESVRDNLIDYEQEEGGVRSDIIPPNHKNKWPQVPFPPKTKIQASSFYQSDPEFKSQVELRVKDGYSVRRANQSFDVGNTHEDSRQKNRLKVDMQALQDKYNKQQSKLDYVKNNFKNYSDCVKLIFQNQLGQFMDNLERVMLAIQSKNNKNKDKLNRLEGKLAVSKSSRRRNNKLSSSFDLGVKRNKSQIGSQIHKTKTKQFESLINKYQHILRSKNQEIQKLSQQIKLKERQLIQMSDKLDEIKEEKRRMGHENDEMVAKLQGKIQALSESKPSAQLKKKQFINLAASRDKQKDPHKQKQKNSKQQSSSQNHLKQVRILESKLSFTETRLAEKLKIIQQMQNQVRTINQNKMSLVNQYQQTLERTRSSHKVKYEEFLSNIETLKSSIRSKDQIISRQMESYKQLEHKYIQIQIQLNTTNQKLLLRQDIQRIERSAVKRAEEIQQNSPLQNLSFTNQNMSLTIQVLEKEKRQLQFNYDKLKGEFQIYKLSSKRVSNTDDLLREKDDLIKQLKGKLQKSMLNSVESPLLKTRETNLLESSIVGDNATMMEDIRNKLKSQQEQNLRLKNINQELKRESITINSKIIGLGHDVALNEELNKQQQGKTKEMKLYIQQLEKMMTQLQKIVQDKTKQLETQKSAFEKQLSTIENELKVMEDEFAVINSELIKETDKVNIKVMEVRHLQDENQDLRVQMIKLNQEKQTLLVKLEDVQEDTKKQGMMDSRINQECKQDIMALKQQIEKLHLQNTALSEANKHQKAKIQQLQLQVFLDTQNQDECMSQTSQMKTQNLVTKLKTLQNINLQHDIQKATLQRHLKNSQENNTKLMQQVNELISELDKKKSQFNTMVITYDEKIHELEEMLQTAEKMLRQKQKQKQQYTHHSNIVAMPNQRIYKSDLRSQSSLMFSNTSQLYAGDKEIDFKLSDDGGSEAGQINVEAIFNNTNYPYENIKLRRKDQIQFIKNTAQLINRLKSTINQKNRKIKGLEKRIAPAKQNQFIGGKLTESLKSEDFDDLQDFNENYSVRFDDRKQDKNRKIRQLQNQTHLVMEQNNLLLQQVTSLQEELQKSEEQQNNLVRLKQILKEEVKKLQKALDQKQALHRQQIQKLQKVIHENEAVHNSQTMRILLPKIFGIVCNQENMRREEKRKELEQYIKIVATILRIQATPVRYSGRR